jgi:hypothetical protein
LSDATEILLQLVLRNRANLQLQVSHAAENQLHKTVAKWQISSSVCHFTLEVIWQKKTSWKVNEDKGQFPCCPPTHCFMEHPLKKMKI